MKAWTGYRSSFADNSVGRTIWKEEAGRVPAGFDADLVVMKCDPTTSSVLSATFGTLCAAGRIIYNASN